MLCVAMLVSSTFAWFTDSVTSGKNIIKSGNLDVEMYWADGTEALDTAEWKDASTDAIFNYDLWEPGYTEVRHVKISNIGSLALKYEIRIAANGEVSKLADVIDVYYIKDGKQITGRAQLTDENKIGTLAEVLANPYAAKGHILAGENAADVATIALKMQESAGNEYQGLAIGSDFAVQLVATQYTAENDSFGNQYDKDAKYPILITKGITKDENGLLTEAIVLGAESADLVSENAPVHVKVPANVVIESDAEDFTLRIEPTTKYPTVSIDDESKAIAYKIEMPLEATNTVPVSVTMFIGENKKLLAVYHDADPMIEADTQAADTYQYDPDSGVITMYLTHCSTFSIEYQLVEMFEASTKDELAAAINTDTDHMIEVNWKGNSFNLSMFDRGFDVTKNITLNAGTNAVTTGESGSYPRFVVKDGGFLTVNAEEFVNANGYNVWPSIATWIKVDGASSTAVLNGGTYSTSFSHAAITAENSGNVLITDGRYSGSGSGGSGTLDYSNGTVTAKSGSTVTVTGGTFSCSGYKTSIFCADDALVIVEDATISSCNGKQFAVFNGGVIKVSKTAFSSKPTSTNGTVAEEENYWVITAAN